ncbi:hypothetical protein [Aureivirga sp. CE67]|uniref:DUF7935 family protein n=1 Tax=Aureivirga sp. CE67 TaxID=1788983 RepID=UPI0018CB2AAB|nr:hypothetical protein [Aureivirga sp. CE67]
MEVIDIIGYTVPAIVTAGASYYIMASFLKNDEKRRKFELLQEGQNTALPLRLQAYERMTLFLERISPNKIVMRIQPISEKKEDYLNLLVQNIEQEFEHNLTQQIYLTKECWNAILTTKNTTIHLLKKATANVEVKNAQQLREEVLKLMIEGESPTTTGLAFLKNEVSMMMV